MNTHSAIRLSNKSSEVGPKRTLAGKHYMSAIVCVFINIGTTSLPLDRTYPWQIVWFSAMLFYIVADVFLSILLTSSRGFSLSIETRIIVGFHVVAAISCAYISLYRLQLFSIAISPLTRYESCSHYPPLRTECTRSGAGEWFWIPCPCVAPGYNGRVSDLP